jgi:hypothetical protein
MDQDIKQRTLQDIIETASLFELHRLSVAFQNACEQPERIKEIKNSFQVGSTIHYYDKVSNTLIRARVLAKKQKYVSVKNYDDLSPWKVPYYLLQLDGGSAKISGPGKALDKESLSVGDWVGFNKDGEHIVGCVQRLNQKTVTLITNDHCKWRVAYSYLYDILDSEHYEKINPALLAEKQN